MNQADLNEQPANGSHGLLEDAFQDSKESNSTDSPKNAGLLSLVGARMSDGSLWTLESERLQGVVNADRWLERRKIDINTGWMRGRRLLSCYFHPSALVDHFNAAGTRRLIMARIDQPLVRVALMASLLRNESARYMPGPLVTGCQAGAGGALRNALNVLWPDLQRAIDADKSGAKQIRAGGRVTAPVLVQSADQLIVLSGNAGLLLWLAKDLNQRVWMESALREVGPTAPLAALRNVKDALRLLKRLTIGGDPLWRDPDGGTLAHAVVGRFGFALETLITLETISPGVCWRTNASGWSVMDRLDAPDRAVFERDRLKRGLVKPNVDLQGIARKI